MEMTQKINFHTEKTVKEKKRIKIKAGLADIRGLIFPKDLILSFFSIQQEKKLVIKPKGSVSDIIFIFDELSLPEFQEDLEKLSNFIKEKSKIVG